MTNTLIKLLSYFPDKPWNWYELSRNPNITPNILLVNSDKPWNWYGLSWNPNITFDIVFANPDKPWNWNGLSWNPNITFDIVLANLDKDWNWYGLSYNKFKYDKELEKIHLKKLTKIRNKVKSLKIKNWYKLFLLTKTEKFTKWYYDPENVGGKRIKKELNILLNNLVK